MRLKIDLYIVPTVALLYLFCFIDRANIGEHSLFLLQITALTIDVGNARLAGLERDLKMTGYDYNMLRKY